MAAVQIERFVDDFCKELKQRNVAIFAGAGLSVPAGYVDWRGLLKPLADELNLSVDREHDLVKVAQYHINHHNNRNDLANAILNGFSVRNAVVTPNHRILARLPIDVYWTTNYDPSIENALKEAGKLADVKHTPDHLVHTLRGREAIVFKMHGDHQHPADAVLAREDYEQYHLKRGDFLTALAGDLLSKTFLFIGFSFSDPNLDYVLSRLYTRHGRNQRKHYCFVKKESAVAGEAPEELVYRKAKQDHFVKDLERYNIRAVMVDTYEQITDVLRLIEARYKSKTVFISGAAHDYGDRWTSDAALDFVHRLGNELIARDYRLVTGLGLGVGSTVVDGALQQIYRVQRKALTDQLVIRPFPQSAVGKNLWPAYRDDMLNFAGMAVFMFGNKLEPASATVVKSDGVIAEFDIAFGKGIKLLPLGFTEFAARDLYDRVAADFATYYPKSSKTFQEQFALLGDASRTLDEQFKSTLIALEELQRI
jgi:hypothetical protein